MKSSRCAQLLEILKSGLTAPQLPRNGHLGNFKITGENQHWRRQLTFWRNFPHCDFGGVRGNFTFPRCAFIRRWNHCSSKYRLWPKSGLCIVNAAELISWESRLKVHRRCYLAYSLAEPLETCRESIVIGEARCSRTTLLQSSYRSHTVGTLRKRSEQL